MRKYFIDCCQIWISHIEERWDKAEILDQKIGYTSNP